MVNDSIPVTWILYLWIPTRWPVIGMLDHPSSNHVHVNVDETTEQVLTVIDRCCMISILPEGTLALFPLVVLLSDSPSNELNRIRNNILAGISDQEVDVST